MNKEIKKEINEILEKLRKESMTFERKRILKMLPQGYKDTRRKDFDKNDREYKLRYREMLGYNRCIVDIKDRLK